MKDISGKRKNKCKGPEAGRCEEKKDNLLVTTGSRVPHSLSWHNMISVFLPALPLCTGMPALEWKWLPH